MIYSLFLFGTLSLVFLELRRSLLSYRYPFEKEYVSQVFRGWLKLDGLWKFLRCRTFTSEPKGKKVKRDYKITKGLAKFALVFSAVSLVYSVLQYWLENTSDIDTALATVLEIEKVQHAVQDFIKPFKVDWVNDLLIITLLISLAGVFTMVERLKDKYKTYKKVVGLVLYVLTISTSFTFFSHEFSKDGTERITNLEDIKLEIVKNNELLYSDINELVSDIVINEIVGQEEVESILQKSEDLQEEVQRTKYEDWYSEAPLSIRVELPLTDFSTQASWNFGFERSFEASEASFHRNWERNNGIDGSFYEQKRSQDFSEFSQRNSHMKSGEYSERSISKNRELFFEAKLDIDRKKNKFYKKYKEPINKLLKKGYGETGKKWINEFFKLVSDDHPFLSQLLDPVIHSNVTDYISKKTERIFDYITQRKTKQASVEIMNIATEFNAEFTPNATSNPQLIALETSLDKNRRQLSTIRHQSKVKIRRYKIQANNHLKQLASNSRWENVRNRFKSLLNMGVFDEAYDYSKRKALRESLDKWEAHKQGMKYDWLDNKVTNLEDEFYSFMKMDPIVEDSWGVMVQQADWENGERYWLEKDPSRVTFDQWGNSEICYGDFLEYYKLSIGKSLW